MRNSTAVALLFVLLASFAFADEVVLQDGKVVAGTVEQITVAGHGVIARAQLSAVRLTMDRGALDSAWVERLLRFALDRSRHGVKSSGRVGVYLGRGVSAPSAIAVVRRLDESKQAPRLLFESDMTTEGLSKLRTLVVPGGWAPSQLASMGATGQSALAQFVHDGGAYLGICAGGYVPCANVNWEGVSFPYPLGLVQGSAIGPVKGLAPWPKAQAVQLKRSKGKFVAALYAGGAYYDVKDATVLVQYPDGQAAAIEARYGQGRLLLVGAHVEFHATTDADLLAIGDWATGIASGDATLFRSWMKRLAK